MRVRGRLLVTAGAILLLPVARAIPQSMDAVREGTRIRMSGPTIQGSPLVGTLVGVDALRLTLELDASHELQSVPRSAVEKLEVSRGRRSYTKKGALIGFGMGAIVAGAALVAVSSGANGWSVDSGDVVAGVCLLGGGGAALGALVGAGSSTERWEEAGPERFVLRIVPTPGGVGVSARLLLAPSR